MAIRSIDNGKRWLVEIDRAGMPRVRKTFTTLTQAEAFKRHYLAANKEQQGLIDILNRYRYEHAQTLSDKSLSILESMMILAAAMEQP